MFRYGIFVLFIGCVDGKFQPEFWEQQTEPDTTILDQDGDGFSPADGDCDDNNIEIFPTAIDRCDGIDNNCDQKIDEEAIEWEWNDDSMKWTVDESVASILLEIDKEDWFGEPFSDGMVDVTHQYAYVGGVLMQEIRERGGQQIQIQYTYNEDGWLLEEKWTSGSWKRDIQYSYDSLGFLLRVDMDDDADGIIEKQQRYQYEDDVLIEYSEYEEGVRQNHTQWEYEGGELVSLNIENSGERVHYQYLDGVQDGERVVLVDWDEDGAIDEMYSQWYDTQGRIVKEGRNLDGMEGFELVSTWRYGDKGFSGLDRFEPSADNEEHILLEEFDAHHFTQTHDIDSTFWEQNIVSQYTLTCASQDSTDLE